MSSPLERMLQIGKHITQPKDPLISISLQRLYEHISSSEHPLHDQIEQLRAIKVTNPDQYKAHKRFLPYFVCGIFRPPHRKLDNMAAMHYLILDLDHLTEIDATPQSLRERLRTDPRLVMDFISPGGDGLKLLFAFSEPVHDAGLYRKIYKYFAADLARKHGLETVVDLRTHDPTRACFLSHDPEARLNKKAIPLSVSDFFILFESDEMQQMVKEVEQKSKLAIQKKNEKKRTQVDDDVLERIKQKINPNARKKKKKEYRVPKEVEACVKMLEELLPQQFELQISSHRPISYGKQIRVKIGTLWAIINIYYGKKGFSIVPTTMSGSHEELAALATEAIRQLVEEWADTLNEPDWEP